MGHYWLFLDGTGSVEGGTCWYWAIISGVSGNSLFPQNYKANGNSRSPLIADDNGGGGDDDGDDDDNDVDEDDEKKEEGEMEEGRNKKLKSTTT